MPSTPTETAAQYRTSAFPVRVLEVSSNHTRGSLTIGTVAAILFAFTFAWFPTINRMRLDFDCTRSEKDNDSVECTITRDVILFKRHETMRFPPADAAAYVHSSEPIPEECTKCSRVVVRTRAGAVGLGRFSATLDEATAATYDLNDFFATPTQKHVHIAYGPGFDTTLVIFWSVVTLLLAASLVVRRFHRVILKWDPVERYLTLERRRWPFPPKVDHVPNDVLVGATISGQEILDTELRFASGRTVSLFGRTVANRGVHEKAVARIGRFIVEEAP